MPTRNLYPRQKQGMCVCRYYSVLQECHRIHRRNLRPLCTVRTYVDHHPLFLNIFKCRQHIMVDRMSSTLPECTWQGRNDDQVQEVNKQESTTKSHRAKRVFEALCDDKGLTVWSLLPLLRVLTLGCCSVLDFSFTVCCPARGEGTYVSRPLVRAGRSCQFG